MGAATDTGGSPWLQLIPFVLVLGIFYFIILLPMRKKQQSARLVGPTDCDAHVVLGTERPARRDQYSLALQACGQVGS